MIVQRKTFAFNDNPLTDDVAEVGEAMEPVPLTRLQVPVPVAGVFPERMAEGEEMQMF